MVQMSQLCGALALIWHIAPVLFHFLPTRETFCRILQSYLYNLIRHTHNGYTPDHPLSFFQYLHSVKRFRTKQNNK